MCSRVPAPCPPSSSSFVELQLNGYFEYLRRDTLLRHIARDDELRVTVNITAYTDAQTRQGTHVKSESPDGNGNENVSAALTTAH